MGQLQLLPFAVWSHLDLHKAPTFMVESVELWQFVTPEALAPRW